MKKMMTILAIATITAVAAAFEPAFLFAGFCAMGWTIE